MRAVVLGGAGFVGLNVAERLVADGYEVTVYDRTEPPPAAGRAMSAGPGRLASVVGDVADADALRAVLAGGIDALVLGAAITAGSAREAADPETILRVNLLAHVGVLDAARAAGVRRIVNLSSAAAYGEAGAREPILAEDGPVAPTNLYGITKYASERIDARLAALWGLDLVSLRLSGVFGPWERETGMRDTLSPHWQVAERLDAGEPALLPRAAPRDWIYGPDVAAAVAAVLGAGRLAHPVYNVSVPTAWTVLAWGERYAASRPGAVCRLAGPGETPTVDLHGPLDRAPLLTDRIAADLGWRAGWDRDASADHYAAWRSRTGGSQETPG